MIPYRTSDENAERERIAVMICEGLGRHVSATESAQYVLSSLHGERKRFFRQCTVAECSVASEVAELLFLI